MPALVVLHYTAMDNAEEALARLSDPQAEVSAHYLIGRDGKLWQMVDEANRAWHAGAGEWHGQTDINSRSIGIELDNRGDHPFSEPLMAALEVLLQDILRRRDIPPANVIGHSDIAPGRKRDPGPKFDWRRLERQRLAAPTVQNNVPDCSRRAFRARAEAAGYTSDASDEDLLNAVRLRHRPWGRSGLGPGDLAVLPLS